MEFAMQNTSVPVSGVEKSNLTTRSPNAQRFDPLSDLLIAQKQRPAHLADINFRTLAPYQRALLVIDGTVTKFLEAYSMEPIQVILLNQENRVLPEDHSWLNAEEGTTTIAREVSIEGKYSRHLHSYAVSLLVYDRLPQGVRDDLKIHPGGLGRILLSHKLETRREVLWYGRESLTTLPDTIRERSDGRFFSRTYRIMFNEQPLMIINEKFPVEADRRLVHH